MESRNYKNNYSTHFGAALGANVLSFSIESLSWKINGIFTKTVNDKADCHRSCWFLSVNGTTWTSFSHTRHDAVMFHDDECIITILYSFIFPVFTAADCRWSVSEEATMPISVVTKDLRRRSVPRSSEIYWSGLQMSTKWVYENSLYSNEVSPLFLKFMKVPHHFILGGIKMPYWKMSYLKMSFISKKPLVPEIHIKYSLKFVFKG